MRRPALFGKPWLARPEYGHLHKCTRAAAPPPGWLAPTALAKATTRLIALPPSFEDCALAADPRGLAHCDELRAALPCLEDKSAAPCVETDADDNLRVPVRFARRSRG